MSSRYLEKGWALPFWMPKKATFCAIYDDLGISPIFNFSPIWWFKKFSSTIFNALDENLPKILYRTTKFISLNWTFLTLWPWMTIIWHKVTHDLGGYLEASQTRSMSFFGFISVWYGCFPRQSQQGQKIKNFTFDVIRDATDKILQYIPKAQARSYEMPFSDRESAQ